MSFYDDTENVQQYIAMCEGYDGQHLYRVLAQHLPNGASLLELGSGAGLDIGYFKDVYKVTGSDLSPAFLNILKNKYPDVPFLTINALQLVSETNYQCIFSNKVLHHLTESELNLSLQQQAKVLPNEGVIAHSFWLGEESKQMHGMLFTYYRREHLLNIISQCYDIQSVLSYAEFEEDDSLFVIARVKEAHSF